MRRSGRTWVVCTASMLVLAAALAVGHDARGQTTAFKIVGGPFAVTGGVMYWLDSANAPPGWKTLPNGSFSLPPIDLSTIASYDGQRVITDSGEGWGKVGGVWTDLGSVPTTAVRQATWGQVKSKYLH